MSLFHANVTVGTTPTSLLTLPNGVGYVAVSIQNRDSAAVYVGDSSVTSASGANGGHLIAATSGTLQLWMHGNETVYAVSAAGTSTGAVSVIYSA
jgi:hypothetical protein